MTPLEQAVEIMEAEYASASPTADLYRAVLDALDDRQACRDWYDTATEAIEDERIVNHPGYEAINLAIQAKADWSRVVARMENAGLIDGGASVNHVLTVLGMFLPD